jgi:uncharacterized protein (DUF2267 family)
MQTREFLEKVRTRAGLRSDRDAKMAVDGVFGVLRARISHAGGDNVAAQLPKELKELWEAGIVDHVVRSLQGIDRLNLDEFFGRAQDAAHLRDAAQAETVTRAVFLTLREQITPGAQYAIENQLPQDIRAFWQSIAEEAQPAGRYGSEEIGPAAATVFRTDDQIAEDIRELIEESNEIDPDQIEVVVHEGIVTLKGNVTSPQGREDAIHAAREVLGTKEIHDQLSVVHAT